MSDREGFVRRHDGDILLTTQSHVVMLVKPGSCMRPLVRSKTFVLSL